MANNTSQEKAETKERTASPEKESKGDAEQTGTAGAKPLAAKSGYYYAHNQVRCVIDFLLNEGHICRISGFSKIQPLWGVCCLIAMRSAKFIN
jgi:hypothetical protein